MKKYILIFISFLFFSLSYVNAQNISDSLNFNTYISKDLDTVYSEFINTGASIRLPMYFELFTQDKYTGFIHKGTASTILAQRIDSTSFLSVTENLTQEVFLKQGAELIYELEVQTNEGRQAKFFIIKFITTNDVPINRIMFFTGDHQNTLLLTANYPEFFAGLMKNVFIASFMTVKFK